MHYYQHNIKQFNNATRHLTRVERSLYRDAIELYYDNEGPLVADLALLYRRLLAVKLEEKEALDYILKEFFYLDGDLYRHDRCDEEIEAYHSNTSAKARAGRASAEARRKKREKAKERNSTGVEQVLNTCLTEGQHNPTNQEPVTSNQEPITKRHKPGAAKAAPSDLTVIAIPTISFDTKGETFGVTEEMISQWHETYPDMDIVFEITKAKTWGMDNPTKRKTQRGMRRFLGSWLERAHNRGDRSQTTKIPRTSTRGRTLEEDLKDSSWAHG